MIAAIFKAACSATLALSMDFLNILSRCDSPCLRRFSVGELNVI